MSSAITTASTHATSTPNLSILYEQQNTADIIDPNLAVGTYLNIDIVVANIPPLTSSSDGGLEGFDTTISYNSSILKTVQMSSASPLCPMIDGCVFDTPSNNTLTYANTIDSNTGTARLAMIVLAQNFRAAPTTSTRPTILFRVTFQVLGQGKTPITIRQDLARLIGYSSSFCQPVQSFTIQNGSFDNRPPFFITANPPSLTIGLRQTGTTTVNVTATRTGETADAVLVVSGITPEYNTTYTLNPTSRTLTPTNPSFTSILVFTVGPNAQLGSHNLEIVGQVPNQGQYYAYRLRFVLTITSAGATASPPRVTSFSSSQVSLTTTSGPNTTPPLITTFSSTPNPLAGNGVQFKATVWCGTPGYAYTWSFGDGTTGTGNSTTHTYTSPRVYPVTLTVTDSTGQSYTSQQIIDVGGRSLAANLDVTTLSEEIGALFILALITILLLMRRRKTSSR